MSQTDTPTRQATQATLAHAARSISALAGPMTEETALIATADLHAALRDDGDCEGLLFLHTQILDRLFNRLIQRAFKANTDFYPHNETITLALRAQQQGRAAMHTLGRVRQTAKRSEASGKSEA